MAGGDEFALYRALSKFLANHTRAFVTIDGTVKKVNDNFTCDVEINGVIYSNVPIAVNIGNQSSLYQIPVIDTNCLMTFRDGHRGLPTIVSFDQVQKLLINCTELVEFNKGLKGGIPETPSLVQRLNLIELKVNTILDLLKGITIPSTPFPFGTEFTAIQDLTETTANEIQSTTITQ